MLQLVSRSSMKAICVTHCAGINILAGSTLGGGTRVNWQASFRTPEHVRQEWAHVHGLKDLISYRYTAALDAVCERVGVTTGQQRLCWKAFLQALHETLNKYKQSYSSYAENIEGKHAADPVRLPVPSA